MLAENVYISNPKQIVFESIITINKCFIYSESIFKCDNYLKQTKNLRSFAYTLSYILF